MDSKIETVARAIYEALGGAVNAEPNYSGNVMLNGKANLTECAEAVIAAMEPPEFLKPCPFCGHAGIHEKTTNPHSPNPDFSWHKIRCVNCKAGTDWQDTKPGACDAWNGRAG